VRALSIAAPVSRADHDRMTGTVERAVRSTHHDGMTLPTPTGNASFILKTIDSVGVVLQFGAMKTATRFDWDCLEGVPEFLRGRGWVPVGANRVVAGNPGTLDEYLKQHVKRQTANYVAVLLDGAGVVELDRSRPARVRLR
jgi:hypothetical protein